MTIGSEDFDDLLNGGFETQAITELVGEFAAGKSQICHTLCVAASKLIKNDSGNIIFVDSENTFRADREHQIAEQRGLDLLPILEKIFHCRVYDTEHLERVINDLDKSIEQYNAKLVIIDSIISLHRAEFSGRGTLAERQQRLGKMLNKLRCYADIYNIAVVITNQVVSYADGAHPEFASTKAAGGNIMGHGSTYRIFLRNSSKQILSDLYPDPRSLPAPPTLREPIPSITLSDLEFGKYVSTEARIAYIKTVEKHDALGEKVVFTGVLEDARSKVSFVSHKISYPLIRDSVYKIYSAYVHEFPDRSLLLVITEFTKLEPKNVEDIRAYSWIPKINAINRPVRYIFLNGTISTVHSTSGLIKRCNKCRSLILYDSTKCPNDCGFGYAWDLRISSKLYDGSGAIKMVLTKDLAAKVLQRNISQLILSASLNESNQYDQTQPNNNLISTLSLEVPSTFDIMEAVLPENVSPSFYTRSDKLIVSDGRNLVYFPVSDNEMKTKFAELNTRHLDANGAESMEDIKIIRRLIERAVSMSIQNTTENKMRHGIYMLEDPISLYRCERAKLYLGFSADIRVTLQQPYRHKHQFTIELSPHAYVRESVLDYVRMRREAGATANAVIRTLLNHRNRVIVAPTGHYGSIVDVISKKASNQIVSEFDNRNLVEFWKQVYDIEILPDEIPLLKIKMLNSENTFTYPASMCFFGQESLYIPASVQKFIEYKRSRLIPRMYDVVKKAVKDLKIGDNVKIQLISDVYRASNRENIQRQILEETRQQLYGRNVHARGSIMYVHDELWFFPNQIQVS